MEISGGQESNDKNSNNRPLTEAEKKEQAQLMNERMEQIRLAEAASKQQDARIIASLYTNLKNDAAQTGGEDSAKRSSRRSLNRIKQVSQDTESNVQSEPQQEPLQGKSDNEDSLVDIAKKNFVERVETLENEKPEQKEKFDFETVFKETLFSLREDQTTNIQEKIDNREYKEVADMVLKEMEKIYIDANKQGGENALAGKRKEDQSDEERQADIESATTSFIALLKTRGIDTSVSVSEEDEAKEKQEERNLSELLKRALTDIQKKADGDPEKLEEEKKKLIEEISEINGLTVQETEELVNEFIKRNKALEQFLHVKTKVEEEGLYEEFISAGLSGNTQEFFAYHSQGFEYDLGALESTLETKEQERPVIGQPDALIRMYNPNNKEALTSLPVFESFKSDPEFLDQFFNGNEWQAAETVYNGESVIRMTADANNENALQIIIPTDTTQTDMYVFIQGEAALQTNRNFAAELERNTSIVKAEKKFKASGLPLELFAPDQRIDESESKERNDVLQLQESLYGDDTAYEALTQKEIDTQRELMRVAFGDEFLEASGVDEKRRVLKNLEEQIGIPLLEDGQYLSVEVNDYLKQVQERLKVDPSLTHEEMLNMTISNSIL